METLEGLKAELKSTQEALTTARQELKEAKDREAKLSAALQVQTRNQRGSNFSSYLGIIVLLGIVVLAVLQVIEVVQLRKLIG